MSASPWFRPAYLATLVATMLVGVLLRFDLTDQLLTSRGLVFSDVRHAHSHLGFYGALTLAWWFLLDRRGAPLVSPAATRIYLGLVLFASGLFAFMGYAWPTIALSTLIAGFWLVAAWRLFRDPRQRDTWLRLAPWGVLIGLLLIPAVAATAKRDPALSRDLAHVFIGVMLLLTFVPVALAELAAPRRHALVFAVAASLGTAHVVFADRLPAPLGLLSATAGLALVPTLVRLPAPRWLRLVWWPLPVGLIAIGLVPPLQQEGIRVAALHYLVLGPLVMTSLFTLVPERLARRPLLLALTLAALAAKLTAMSLAPLLAWPPGTIIAAWSAVALVLALALLVLGPGAPPAPSPRLKERAR